MAAFIILIIVFLPCVFARLWWRADWQAIEEENKRYYTAEGHHVYYDRKLIASLEKEKPEVKTAEEKESKQS